MSEIELNTVEVEINEVYPFVYTIVKEDFETNFKNSARTFSQQMFVRGTNTYVQSYTKVAMPVVVEDNTIVVNKTKGFKLPINFPYLISWAYCDNNKFNFHIKDKKIPCETGGLIFYPSWLENTKLTVEGKFDVEMRQGCCTIPLEHV